MYVAEDVNGVTRPGTTTATVGFVCAPVPPILAVVRLARGIDAELANGWTGPRGCGSGWSPHHRRHDGRLVGGTHHVDARGSRGSSPPVAVEYVAFLNASSALPTLARTPVA